MPKGVSARSSSLTSQESSYSAVIIADMVAEVQQQTEHKKEEVNSNGTNISKGVILNALQFGQNDNKISKPVVTIAQRTNGISLKEEFNQMSSLRKVAFGFSFLPSIMFVLCFAVIFPCEKILPCVDVKWNIDLNDTEITSNLFVPMNVFFTFSNQEESGLRSLSESSGKLLWENNLTSSAEFFKCGKFAYADKESCLILDNNGTMHLFDPSDGRKIWELKWKIFSVSVLPDCNKDGLDEIAVSTTEIRILSLRNIFIKDCNPFNLIAWKRPNETDLIFSCKKGENETLMKISQEEWCRTDENEVKISTLASQKAGILSKFLPMNEGLIIWTQDFVTMYKSDNHQQWSVPCSNHSSKNRFLMSGKFRNDKKEVFLYSSEISANLQVTRLNVENGNTIETKTYPHIELTEAVLINGEEYDFVLGLKEKQSQSLKNKAVSQINEVSTSVINILTNNEVNSFSTNARIIQEISLMEMDGNDLKTIQSEELTINEPRASSFTVILKNNLVELFVLRELRNKHMETTIRSITISNWDTSSEKTSHCVWK